MAAICRVPRMARCLLNGRSPRRDAPQVGRTNQSETEGTMESYALLFTLASFASLVGCTQSAATSSAPDGASEDVAEADQALTPAGGDQCATIDAAAIGDLIDIVESAQDRAESVLAAHPGQTHTYMAQ